MVEPLPAEKLGLSERFGSWNSHRQQLQHADVSGGPSLFLLAPGWWVVDEEGPLWTRLAASAEGDSCARSCNAA